MATNLPAKQKEPGHCLSCGSTALRTFLDLGLQPLANSLVKPGDTDPFKEPRYPLELAECCSCHLLQLTHVVPPEKLFSEYVYFSSFSAEMLRHAEQSAVDRIAEMQLGPQSQVIEIASNDGYLLKHFAARSIPALGIEPAANVAAVARRNGVETLEAFFNEELALRLVSEGRLADLILANNVFAHVPDTNGFMSALARLLKPNGVAVLEFPWALEMLRQTEFDTIYHEHVFYVSALPFSLLAERHGLELFRVERLSLHGGSLRVYLSPKGTRGVESSVLATIDEERACGVTDPAYLDGFAHRVQQVRQRLRNLLFDLKAKGHSIAAYGASAKGSTLLNYCDIGDETIDFIADRSPYKQGLFSPGKRIPIVDPETLVRRQPAFTVLLTWNFAQEIMAQQETYLKHGGRFIIPVPIPQVIP